MLRETSSAVSDLAGAAETFADLRDTLHEFQRTQGFGRGIGAVQIGALERLIYLEFKGEPIALVNPEFEFLSPVKFRLWDDCFSFPDLLVYLERSETVRIRYLDDLGVSRQLEASGALSELLQHEMDHLDGILAVDRAMDRYSLCTRDEFDRRLKREATATRPMK